MLAILLKAKSAQAITQLLKKVEFHFFLRVK